MECSICYETINEGCLLGCSHVFHKGCIDTWTARGEVSCPMCRHSITIVAHTHDVEEDTPDTDTEECDDINEPMSSVIIRFADMAHDYAAARNASTKASIKGRLFAMVDKYHLMYDIRAVDVLEEVGIDLQQLVE